MPSYLHAADKTAEALKTFTPIKSCVYTVKTLGLSGQEEAITCDCVQRFEDGKNVACGEDSDCINRLTSVECIDGNCIGCGPECSNQRFQKRQYAKILVFQTEKKGYGVRADTLLAQGTFIHEYIGEVINEATFRKRMATYDSEGIKHFYFMMLQKDEFIDATKKGLLARFCNHSCSPNAYVDKWVVGKKLRMGIFAKRNIKKGEEICFDYNVDRYGANAQPCYCGEKNCIGFLGGKTQTDLARLLPQALADALGISAADEKLWVKTMRSQNKKFKKKNDEGGINVEFVKSVEIRPLSVSDVPRVMSVLMVPNQEQLVVQRLVERVYISDSVEEADEINKQLIKMHGYKAFSTILKEAYKQKNEEKTVLQMLEILLRWPAQSKNKITSSKIEETVKTIALGTGITAEKASELLKVWDNLQMAYRIRKAENGEAPKFVLQRRKAEEKPEEEVKKRQKVESREPREKKDKKDDKKMRGDRKTEMEKRISQHNKKYEKLKQAKEQEKADTLAKIIEDARKADEKKRKEQQLKEEQERIKKEMRMKAKVLDKDTYIKMWTRVFAKYVPNMIKRHEEQLGHEKLKAKAREIVQILADKEYRRRGDVKPPSELDENKLKKVRIFVKEYMTKYLQKRAKLNG